MVTIFIGHARQDSDAAAQVAKSLAGQGYTVRTSEEAAIGANWREMTENAIRAADAYLYLHSPNATSSPWLQNELLYVLSQQKPIIPVILAPADIPQSLLNYQFVDATRSIESAQQKIALAVDAVTSFPPVQATERARTEVRRSADQTAAPAASIPMPAAPPAPQPVRAAPKSSRATLPLIIGIVIIVVLGLLIVISSLQLNALPPGMVETRNAENTQIAAAIALTSTSEAQVVTTPTAGISFTTEPAGIEVAVAGTVAAIRATDEGSISAAQLALIAPLIRRDDTPILLIGLLAALSLGVSGAAMFVILRSGSRRTPPRRAHSPHHSQPNPTGQSSQSTVPLAAYEAFISSSEQDREWVKLLVDDLQTMDFMVWWYAKDAPGLPFGNEIRSAIYHSKVFLIIISPDSMGSKHVEEEIRWAEIYDRPIVPVVYRTVSIEERLYGLAKGADIDFTNDDFYRESLDLLAGAIDHHLRKRLEALPTGAQS